MIKKIAYFSVVLLRLCARRSVVLGLALSSVHSVQRVLAEGFHVPGRRSLARA